ncbi:hypothetical protein ACF0H5_009497 [Mactra antiquata]
MAEKRKYSSNKLTYIIYSLRNSVYLLVLFYTVCSATSVLSEKCNKSNCVNGNCTQNNTECLCFEGWTGVSCSLRSQCSGRKLLNSSTGVITDGAGNYSVYNKCMWLVKPDPPSPGTPLRFKTSQFATECGWDHLYIFDGDSIFSPVIAAFSGLVQAEINSTNYFDEVVAKSGEAYIYFYSDAAYNMSGFTLTYSVGGCPYNCSGNGACTNSTCSCYTEYTGEYCQTQLCPNNCSGSNGRCTNDKCVCELEFKGNDCSTSVKDALWTIKQSIHYPVGRASPASILIDDELVITGGYSFGQDFDFLTMYNITSDEWQTVSPFSSENPQHLYGHSMIHYKDCLYIYGGVSGKHIESKLWIYNATNDTWSYKKYDDIYAVAGHSSIVIGNIMYIIFGHSPIYGYMNTVQEMNLDDPDLLITTIETNGALVKGGYGHSSVYNDKTKEIYIYGGFISGHSSTQYSLSDHLYSYHPINKQWKILASSGSVRYLHTAVMLGELMLVFGGNTHNDSSTSHGALCYSPDFIAYDPECNTWKRLNVTSDVEGSARYGHVAHPYKSGDRLYMYIFGGFTGIMMNDLLVYEPGDCSVHQSKNSCITSNHGRVCVWTNDGLCIDREYAHQQNINNFTYDPLCLPMEGAEKHCHEQESCGSCLSTVYNCKWCSNNCSTSCSSTDKYTITKVSDCPLRYNTGCSLLHNCYACLRHEECVWSKLEKKKCSYSQQDSVSFFGDITEFYKEVVNAETEGTKTAQEACDTPCYLHSECENCTSRGCMWCGSQQRCVENNSYVASFLYGQCQEWVTHIEKCPATRCEDLRSCDECKTHPTCGWCNDVSNTGLGKCVPGGASGPMTRNSTTGDYELNIDSCPADRWHFITCPLCQCNGHSTCVNNTDKCEQCDNLTTGEHCEKCVKGYYGTPANGGNCTACSCNGQADYCHHVTGACFCRTRGVIGDKCQTCEYQNNYFGNPNDGGTCYYDLRTDYQFTFNLSKNEDMHYTGINFMNIPLANDRDVEFTLNCSGSALINITWKSKSHPQEQYKTRGYSCSSFRSKFEHKDYNFGPDHNFTFFVYVYNFTTPFWLQISFSQFPKIDLVHFFVTFFSCFLSLLIIAAILYKIKHKYDSYRRRQRMIVEMEEMASRPFSTAVLEIEKRIDNTGAEKKETNTDLRKRKRPGYKPGQVTLEPLNNQKAAVLSLFIQLPCGDSEWSPPGHTGLAIGSALVTLGHQRKQSAEFVKTEKTKHKKHTIITHDTNV